MIVPRRVVPPLTLLVALVTVTVTYNSGIAQAPRDFFGVRDDIVLMLPSTGQVSSSAGVTTGVVGSLRERPDVSAVSPEVVVMTASGDASVFARGVDAEAFLEIEGAHLIEGRMPARAEEALAGAGAARRFGIALGDRVLLPASLRQGAAQVEIVGIYDGPGAARDELLLTLALARGLAGVPLDAAHMIRVRTSDPANISQLVGSVAPAFTYSDVRISGDVALLGEGVVVTANLTNWGLVPGVKDVTLLANGAIVAREAVFVGARSMVPIRMAFIPAGEGEVNVSLNPTFTVDVRAKSAFLAGLPPAFVVGEPRRFPIATTDGTSAAGIELVVDGVTTVADASGSVDVVLASAGSHDVLLRRDGDPVGAHRLYATIPEFRDTTLKRVREVRPPSGLLDTEGRGTLNITLENAGGVVGEIVVNVTVDGEPAAEARATLAPGEFQRVIVELQPLQAGPHEVRVEGFPGAMRVEAVEGDPRVEEALRARQAGRDSALVAHVGEEATDYVDRIVARVSIAATALSVAAGALAALGALATWSRHLTERAPSIGLLKSLGGRRTQVEWIASREAALASLIATILGISAGVLIALALDATGFVRGFGHVVHPSFELGTLSILALLATGANVLLARQISSGLFRLPADELLRGELLVPATREPPALRDVLRESD